jgi:hypothetical protein
MKGLHVVRFQKVEFLIRMLRGPQALQSSVMQA